MNLFIYLNVIIIINILAVLTTYLYILLYRCEMTDPYTNHKIYPVKLIIFWLVGNP